MENLEQGGLFPENEQVVKLSEDRQTILDFVTREADDKAKRAAEKAFAFKNERIALTGGGSTSIFEQEEAYKKFIAENENHEGPFFSEYIVAFDNFMKWPKEITDKFCRPKIAPDTINQTIYDRYGKGFLDHIKENNKFVKYFIRRTKNYKLLNEEGLYKLVIFINDNIQLLNECKTYYEFRKKHSEKFGTFFQPELFEEYN